MNCGTLAGYQRHRYYQTRPCDPCLAANARKSAEDRGGYKRGPRGRYNRGVTDCIIDVMSTHARWLTSRQVVDLVLDLHPEWNPASVRRILGRLTDRGIVQTRPDPDCPQRRGLLFFCDEWAVA